MAISKTITMLPLLVLLLSIPTLVLSGPSLTKLPVNAPGPLAFAFDVKGGGPYTTVADGRILKYRGSKAGFTDYAFTAPNRSKELCDGTNSVDLGPTCGRGSGLGFYFKTGELFIADPYFGLVMSGPKGGAATQLATSADGVPFRFADALEVDQATGNVYFTDLSANYGLDEIGTMISTADSSGRLLKYDPNTQKVTVLLSGLSMPTGVAVSKDGSFLLFIEFLTPRVRKHWLKGSKANTVEVILNLIGTPDKIRRTVHGDFWLATTVTTGTTVANIGQRINARGAILETVMFSPEFNATSITEVQEHDDKLYLGNLSENYVGVYKGLKQSLDDL